MILTMSNDSALDALKGGWPYIENHAPKIFSTCVSQCGPQDPVISAKPLEFYELTTLITHSKVGGRLCCWILVCTNYGVATTILGSHNLAPYKFSCWFWKKKPFKKRVLVIITVRKTCLKGFSFQKIQWYTPLGGRPNGGSKKSSKNRFFQKWGSDLTVMICVRGPHLKSF